MTPPRWGPRHRAKVAALLTSARAATGDRAVAGRVAACAALVARLGEVNDATAALVQELGHLGSALANAGATQLAIDAASEAVRVCEVAYGANAGEVCVAKASLGEALRYQGDLAGASAALAQAQDMDGRLGGEDGSAARTAFILDSQSRVAMDQGDRERAVMLARQGVEVIEGRIGPGVPELASHLLSLAVLLIGGGGEEDRATRAEAEELLHRMIGIGGGPEDHSEALVMLGELKLKDSDRVAGEGLLRQALDCTPPARSYRASCTAVRALLALARSLGSSYSSSSSPYAEGSKEGAVEEAKALLHRAEELHPLAEGTLEFHVLIAEHLMDIGLLGPAVSKLDRVLALCQRQSGEGDDADDDGLEGEVRGLLAIARDGRWESLPPAPPPFPEPSDDGGSPWRPSTPYGAKGIPLGVPEVDDSEDDIASAMATGDASAEGAAADASAEGGGAGGEGEEVAAVATGDGTGGASEDVACMHGEAGGAGMEVDPTKGEGTLGGSEDGSLGAEASSLCAACGAPGGETGATLLPCVLGCGGARWYCSRKCYKDDWRAGHYVDCNQELWDDPALAGGD